MTVTGLSRRAGIVATAVVLVAAAAFGQPAGLPADPIDAARASQRIADQKAQSDVLRAIQDADRLARTNPAQAAQALRAAQNGIDLSAAISGETRRSLTTLLQAKIASLGGRALPNSGAKADPAAATVRASQKAALEASAAEEKAVREGIAQVQRYQDANLKAEADRIVARLAVQYPNNPAVLALTRKDAFADRVADAQAFSKMQGERVLLALNDVTKSSIPPKGDIEFPADWKQRTAKRKKDVELTAKEKSLIEALDKPVTLLFNNRPLEEALQDLSNTMNQPLLLDKKSIDDLGVDLKKPVNLDAKGLSARTVLRQIVGAQGLTFVVKDETIQVVTVEKARDMLVTRVYYLGDLVQGVGPFGGSVTWGPFLDFQQTTANVKLVIDAIQSSIDPLSWKEKGGPGTITFHFPSMSLIVRASSEVHASLGSKLGGGK